MAEKLLGIDYGSRRIGLALGDGETGLAEPLRTVSNEQFPDTVRQLIAERGIDRLVVGLPHSLDGNETAQTKRVKQWIELQLEPLGLPIETVPEEGTTSVATERLKSRGVDDIASAVDAEAASIILQDYLDSL